MIWPPLQPAAPRAREDGALELTPRQDGVDKKRRVQSMPANWHQVGSDLTALAENGPLGKIPTTLQTMQATVFVRPSLQSPEKQVTPPQTSSTLQSIYAPSSTPRDASAFTVID